MTAKYASHSGLLGRRLFVATPLKIGSILYRFPVWMMPSLRNSALASLLNPALLTITVLLRSTADTLSVFSPHAYYKEVSNHE
jgi:hypothetical protein